MLSDAGGEAAAQIFRSWEDMRLGQAALAVGLGLGLILLLKWFIPRLASWLPDRYRFYILPWEPILRLLILAALLAWVTPLIIRPTPQNLLAISGAMAVAIGFAFKDYASSLIAGIVALYERPYRAGDWVRIEQTYGEVASVGLRTIRVLTADDTMVAIPHLKIWGTAVQNANTGQPELMCVADFYLHPEHDGDAVREALGDVAYTSPYLQLTRPVIVTAAQEPWGTHYRLKGYPIEGRDQFQFLTDLTLRGKASLQRLGARQSSVPALPRGG